MDLDQVVISHKEQLDLKLLNSAWQQVVDQHPVLRTNFVLNENSDPIQIVNNDVNLDFNIIDIQTVDVPSQQERIDQFLVQDRQQGFDLNQAPLTRVTILQLAEARFTTVWTVSHVIIDARSFPDILTEVFDRYNALLTGQTYTATKTPQFRDHVELITQKFERRSAVQGILVRVSFRLQLRNASSRSGNYPLANY